MPPLKFKDYCLLCGSPLDPLTSHCWACRYEQEQYQQRCLRARLPPAAHSKRFSDFVTDPQHHSLIRTLRSCACCYLWGKTGSGKTHLLWAAAWEAVEQKREALYIGWAGYLEELRESFPQHQLPPLYYQARNTDLLCLDDLSILRWSPWAAEQLYLLIEERLQYRRQTLIASLLSPQQLWPTLPDYLLSRLRYAFTLLELLPRDGRKLPYPQQKLLPEKGK